MSQDWEYTFIGTYYFSVINKTNIAAGQTCELGKTLVLYNVVFEFCMTIGL